MGVVASSVWWCRCGGVGVGGSRWRVAASDIGDRVDPEVGSIFGVGRKSSPENFSGGCGGGRRLPDIWGGRREIYKSVSVCYKEMDQDSAHMVAASKVPMFKLENGNAPPITKVVEGVETIIALTTAEETA
ncbi:hypothetical protein Tco_0268709 [Tanacetum coccineum]